MQTLRFFYLESNEIKLNHSIFATWTAHLWYNFTSCAENEKIQKYNFSIGFEFTD